MAAQPTKLELTSDGRLRITWSDGQVREYSPAVLRDACPCAVCREKRQAPHPSPTELTVLSPAEAQPLRFTAVKPVGNYAYSIHFSDGHDTGIYTLELLQKLGEEVASG